MSVSWKDLSVKLPALVLVISLLPLLGFGYFAIRTSQQELLATQARASQRTALQGAATIGNHLFELLEDLELAAANLAGGEASQAEWNALIKTILQQEKGLQEVVLVNPSGREIARVTSDEISLTNASADHSRKPAFREALGGSYAISSAHQAAAGGYTATLGVPFRNPETRQVEAVVLAELRLHQVMALTLSLQVGQEGGVYVINRQGQIIGHENMSLTLGENRLENLALVKGAARYRNVEGIQVLGTAVPIRGTDWLVVAERPLVEIKAVGDHLRNLLSAILLVTALLTTLLLVWFMRFRLALPLARLERGAARIGAGQFGDPMPEGRADEIGRMTKAFNLMAAKLQQFTAETERNDWLRSGMNELDAQLRGAPGIKELADVATTYLAGRIDAQVGAFYVSREQGLFEMAGGYAWQGSEDVSRTFAVGEGLVGQAAREQRLLEIDAAPPNYLRIASGLGSADSVHLLVMPLVFAGETVGVMEFGSFQAFRPREKAFLERSAEPVAITLNAASSRLALKQALEKEKTLSEELQAQQEELRASNEELEEQTQHLQASEEQLKTQEEELRTTNEELEEKTEILEERQREILARNRELQAAQRRLAETARDLQAANRYKSEFLANMSHELRTPLNSLLILARDLMTNQNGNLSDDQVESASVIYNSGQDLLALINEVLDLAKIESGKMSLQVVEVEIAEVGERLEGNFRPLADEKGLDFAVTIDENVPETVQTDRQRFEQIAKNLLGNALKFTTKGSVEVHFYRPEPSAPGLSPEIADGCFAMAVRDTGIGIAEDKLQEIFEAFKQADGSISRQFGGTGLGLSISMNLVRILGGALHVASEEGRGSTFTLYLPLTLAVEPESATKSESSASERELPPAKASVTDRPQEDLRPTPVPALPDDRDQLQAEDRCILIIEDDLKFAKILSQLCHKRDFRVLHAADGETGIKLIRDYQPDAIFLDLKLPGIQGFEVLDWLKKNSDLRHIPVHVMSVEEQASRAHQLGAVGFLNKPIGEQDLEQAFARITGFAKGNLRRLLVAEDDPNQQKAIALLIGNGDVQTVTAGSGREVLEKLRCEQFDCMILDLSLSDISGFALLKKLKEEEVSIPPTIVYTGRELSPEEVEQLQEYASSIIIKGAQSPERLLDEASLFLHRVVAGLPEQKQKMIRALYESDEAFLERKLLLVDDDMRNVFAIGKILGDRGFHVFKAANGQKALEILDAEPDMDIVLMDIMMPVMDGYEAMREIRRQRRFADLPILALTAKAMRDDRQRCIEAGANDYVTKPVDIDRLLSLLRVWLHR